MCLITATPHRITQCYTAGPSSVSNGIEPEMLLTACILTREKLAPASFSSPLIRCRKIWKRAALIWLTSTNFTYLYLWYIANINSIHRINRSCTKEMIKIAKHRAFNVANTVEDVFKPLGARFPSCGSRPALETNLIFPGFADTRYFYDISTFPGRSILNLASRNERGINKIINKRKSRRRGCAIHLSPCSRPLSTDPTKPTNHQTGCFQHDAGKPVVKRRNASEDDY